MFGSLAGQTVLPVQTAVRYQVPLIIRGEHQGLEQVGMFSHEHEVEMTRRYRRDHDLMWHEADDIMAVFDMSREEDVWQYRYPHDADLDRVRVRGIHLGNLFELGSEGAARTNGRDLWLPGRRFGSHF